MITVNLEYYAQFREQAKTGEEQWSTAAGSIAELYEELRAHHGFQLPRQVLRAAVNAEFSEWSRPLHEGDTIVFISPVAGG